MSHYDIVVVANHWIKTGNWCENYPKCKCQPNKPTTNPPGPPGINFSENHLCHAFEKKLKIDS